LDDEIVTETPPRPTRISKIGRLRLPPNVADLDSYRSGFNWADVERELAPHPHPSGFNIAHLAVDRIAAGPRRDHLAIRWRGRNGETRDLSYGAGARFLATLDHLLQDPEEL
jgi:acetyl-CoA synthetase